MERLILGLSLLLFFSSVCILFYVRRSMLVYTALLMDSFDAVLAGKKDSFLWEAQETLTSKLQMKLYQLCEVIEKKSEENLHQKERLESMISDISHQVKTPIASIRMYHSLLERKELKEEKREEFLYAAEHQVDKLEFFMKSMIRMSRLETGIIKVEPEENSVYELIEQAVCDAALKAEEKGIDIDVSCGEELTAYFDKKWTVEAVFNILDNGVKYTKTRGRIEISAGKTDFFVRIGIKDNGRGIREERIPEIFKRFYREPESAEIEGVGIGLYLAREIIMKQRGFIEVCSKPGEGTSVYVNLPIERK